MGGALATTEDGQRGLAEAEGRANHMLAKELEESDARPERGVEVIGPVGGLDEYRSGNPLTQPSDTAISGVGLPVVDLSAQRGARRQAPEKLQGPRWFNDASARYRVTVVGGTPIDDWLEGAGMDIDNGDPVPQCPQLDDDYGPTVARGGATVESRWTWAC